MLSAARALLSRAGSSSAPAPSSSSSSSSSSSAPPSLADLERATSTLARAKRATSANVSSLADAARVVAAAVARGDGGDGGDAETTFDAFAELGSLTHVVRLLRQCGRDAAAAAAAARDGIGDARDGVGGVGARARARADAREDDARVAFASKALVAVAIVVQSVRASSTRSFYVLGGGRLDGVVELDDALLRRDDDLRSRYVSVLRTIAARLEEDGVAQFFLKTDHDDHLAGGGGALYLTLVPIRPRSRGERRTLRTFAVVSLRPGSLAFNPRPRRLSTPLLTPFNSTPTFASYGQLPSGGDADAATAAAGDIGEARGRSFPLYERAAAFAFAGGGGGGGGDDDDEDRERMRTTAARWVVLRRVQSDDTISHAGFCFHTGPRTTAFAS